MGPARWRKHDNVKLALQGWEIEEKFRQMVGKGKEVELKRIDLAIKRFHKKVLVARAKENQRNEDEIKETEKR
ncbi:unnamed protein product [Blepharisma stoltei]|uniref:Uncharacterized protein n=1 Tax=Blepharisma stoltei TaxID=1481888 RepID=A0AAU9I9F5_9CILI|nr:unnamed protein product [Blepharisma stoltei]